MISYERIESNNSQDVKCMICNYSYSSDSFKCQPYVCNGCLGFSMTVINLSDFFILNINGVDYRVYVSGIHKKEAANILNNSILSNKDVL